MHITLSTNPDSKSTKDGNGLVNSGLDSSDVDSSSMHLALSDDLNIKGTGDSACKCQASAITYLDIHV